MISFSAYLFQVLRNIFTIFIGKTASSCLFFNPVLFHVLICTGWGTLTHGGNYPDILQEVTVSVSKENTYFPSYVRIMP